MEYLEINSNEAIDAINYGYDVRNEAGEVVDADYINDNPDENYYS